MEEFNLSSEMLDHIDEYVKGTHEVVFLTVKIIESKL